MLFRSYLSFIQGRRQGGGALDHAQHHLRLKAPKAPSNREYVYRENAVGGRPPAPSNRFVGCSALIVVVVANLSLLIAAVLSTGALILIGIPLPIGGLL